jgi:hypothetical protein
MPGFAALGTACNGEVMLDVYSIGQIAATLVKSA